MVRFFTFSPGRKLICQNHLFSTFYGRNCLSILWALPFEFRAEHKPIFERLLFPHIIQITVKIRELPFLMLLMKQLDKVSIET
jgi:hypothetical protein